MSETKEKVITILHEVSPVVSFDPERDGNRDLIDLGVDSLDQMSLFLMLQEQFEIGEIPEEDIDNLTTVDLIVAYLDQKKAEIAG